MKILVSDFDNTFYTTHFDHNRELVRDFVNKGNIFIIATGRNINQLLGEIEYYDIPYSYLICNDGSMIYDKNLHLVFKITIPQETVKPIFQAFDKSRFITETFIDVDGDFTSIPDCDACSIIARPKDKKRAYQLLDDILKHHCNVEGYINEQWINIVSADASKGNAMKYLEIENHYNYYDIYAVGDGINDLSMNEVYQSFALENGCEELYEVSNYRAKNFEEVIERLNESNHD